MEPRKTRREEEGASVGRLSALLAGQRPDRVPLYLYGFGFCTRMAGYPISRIYDDVEKSFWAQTWTKEMYDSEDLIRIPFITHGTAEFGGEIKMPSSEWSQAPSIRSYPVQSEEDVAKLELPDVRTAGLLPMLMEFSKLQDNLGSPIIPCTVGGSVSRAANLCGVDKLCRWMIRKPELVHKLVRLITDHFLDMIRYWVDTFGPERVILFGGCATESNQVISPKQFKEFAFPYLKEMGEKALALGIKHIFYHICGEQNLNLPYWAQIPMGDPGIASFGHEIDLTTAIEYLGDTCIIAGNVEPAVIQTGTPQQVYELAKQCIEKGKYAPRGFMLMSGCELPPMAPPYNVYVMKKAVEDFGWYD